MKKLFFLAFIVLMFLNCNNSSVEELRDNALLKKYFTKEEIKDLEKIIDFYDNIVLSKTKTDNINDAYLKYFSKIKEDFNSKGIPCMDTVNCFPGFLKVLLKKYGINLLVRKELIQIIKNGRLNILVKVFYLCRKMRILTF